MYEVKKGISKIMFIFSMQNHQRPTMICDPNPQECSRRTPKTIKDDDRGIENKREMIKRENKPRSETIP
jgi:hypothetical protein